MLRRTPCIGICSTTYGDLVCRGCKRFAHEIVQWNGFDGAQRRTVWNRLLGLRAGSAAAIVAIVDEALLRSGCQRLGIDVDQLDAYNLAYEVLQRLQWREPRESVASFGIRLREDAAGAEPDPATVLSRIDQEFWQRSVADYERSYRIPAQ